MSGKLFKTLNAKCCHLPVVFDMGVAGVGISNPLTTIMLFTNF